MKSSTHPKNLGSRYRGVNHRSRGETGGVYRPEEGVPGQAGSRGLLSPETGFLPRLIEFREELPKTMVGKVLRRILREEELHKSDTEQDKECLSPEETSKEEVSARRLESEKRK